MFGLVAEIYPQAFICISHFEDNPELIELIKAPQLYACCIATSSWVSVSVDDNTLQKADAIYCFRNSTTIQKTSGTSFLRCSFCNAQSAR
jgi:hypothetical protein